MQPKHAPLLARTLRRETQQEKPETIESIRRLPEPWTGQDTLLPDLLDSIDFFIFLFF